MAGTRTHFYFRGSTIWPLNKCLSWPNPEALLVGERSGTSRSLTFDLLLCPITAQPQSYGPNPCRGHLSVLTPLPSYLGQQRSQFPTTSHPRMMICLEFRPWSEIISLALALSPLPPSFFPSLYFISLSFSVHAHMCTHAHTHTTHCTIKDSILKTAGRLLWVVTHQTMCSFGFPWKKPPVFSPGL